MERIKHLLNLDEQRYIVMGGLQGAGKSTVVTEFEKVGYVVVCPDRIRFELASREKGNEGKLESELEDSLHKYEALVWRLAEQRVKEALKEGKSVVFDATSSTVKARKVLVQWGKTCGVDPIAVYVECPLEIAQERNLQRGSTILAVKNGQPVYGRYVPGYVIELKWRFQVLPLKSEGFKETYILHVDLRERNFNPDYVDDRLKEFYHSTNLAETLELYHNMGELKDLLPCLDRCWGVSQEHKNHNLDMHMHMIKAAEELKGESFELFLAGLLHDVGKFETKTKFAKMVIPTEKFKEGSKVEIKRIGEDGFVIIRKLDYKGLIEELVTIKHLDMDPNAHYYEHDLVGAVIARRAVKELGYSDEFADKIYEYVLYHMAIPFHEASIDTMRKLVKRIGAENARLMLKMRRADKIAGSAKDYLDNVHQEHVRMIEEAITQDK